MECLKNSKHERFAQLVAAGESQGQAWASVYKTTLEVGMASSSRALRDVKGLSDRILELKQASATSNTLTMQERRECLAELKRCVVNQLSLDSPLINRIKRTFGESGESVEIWLPDKLRAIELDARLSGELIDKQAHTVDFVRPITIRLPGILTDVQAAAQRRKGLAQDGGKGEGS